METSDDLRLEGLDGFTEKALREFEGLNIDPDVMAKFQADAEAAWEAMRPAVDAELKRVDELMRNFRTP